MKEEVIGKRYAKALIELARQQERWEEVGDDLRAFMAVFEENEVLRRVLCDPVHDRTKRRAILKVILARMGTGTLCSHFLQLLVDKERMGYMGAIFSAYQRLEDAMAGRLRARLVTAKQLDQEEMAAVQRALEQRFQKRIILEWVEDPEILGGVICRVDGMVFDGSVRTQLEGLKESMKGE